MKNSKIKDVKGTLKESSLSRVWWHNHEHDCGAMTAFRTAMDCGKGKKYSNNDNQKRNKSLRAKLQSMGYGITKMVGRYPEGGKNAHEIAFFVVDLNDTGTLEKDLRKIGEMFEQDSILFIPRKAIENEAKAYLIGTNHCKSNWLGYGKKEIFNKGKIGVSNPIYTSKIGGRPFVFEAVGEMYVFPGNGYGWWALNVIANQNWQDIIED